MGSMSDRSCLRVVAENAELGHFLAFSLVLLSSFIMIRVTGVHVLLQCILERFCVAVALQMESFVS